MKDSKYHEKACPVELEQIKAKASNYVCKDGVCTKIDVEELDLNDIECEETKALINDIMLSQAS